MLVYKDKTHQMYNQSLLVLFQEGYYVLLDVAQLLAMQRIYECNSAPIASHQVLQTLCMYTWFQLAIHECHWWLMTLRLH
jgi:hypothetical protein